MHDSHAYHSHTRNKGEIPIPSFHRRVEEVDPSCSRFDSLRTLQLNLGDLCNLACAHCHVNASPDGRKIMGREVMDTVLDCLRSHPGLTLDITGGCPELNPHFLYLLDRSRTLAPRRMVRTNLAVLCETDMTHLPELYRDHALVLFASLPCFLEANVDRQRGSGVFEKSVAALRRLNSVGYGDTLELNLVFNPGDYSLPPSQTFLETLYRKELGEMYGIRFTSLFTITNAPLGRFRRGLEETGTFDTYLRTLAERFNPQAAHGIMCRSLISINWQGTLFDCDFNLAAGLPIRDSEGTPLNAARLPEAAQPGRKIVLGEHCFCCTAGEGSSCSGVTAVPEP
jgi:radical SAM/Cys-rich protein